MNLIPIPICFFIYYFVKSLNNLIFFLNYLCLFILINLIIIEISYIDRIINNRIKSQEKLNETLIEKRNANRNTNMNISGFGTSNSNYVNNNKSMSKSQNNFCNLKLKNIELNKKEENKNKKDFKQILLEKIKKDEEEKKKIEEEIAKIEEEENKLLFELSNNKITDK